MEPVDLARMRSEYSGRGIEPNDLADHPIDQLRTWLAEALDNGVIEPNAMVVSTVDTHGNPRGRNLLAKGVSHEGIDFYSNYESIKGEHLGDRGPISATFSWLELNRQVLIAGSAIKLPADVSDVYFALRPRDSQLGAWASDQSRVIPDRQIIDRAFEAADQRFPDEVPRPPHWGGYRIEPVQVEFWQGRLNRLHDRIRFCQTDNGWIKERLSP